ncbi:MAG: type IV toxin-antitoxin system AbiEi family antitoxin [Oscillospiraceae bacterium]|nr:type IV toxin-antitoxin system AbiEi family antitoxin [Oscillospiraceae bacterium]
MKEYTQIRYWVDELPRLGRSTFSLSEVREQFPQKPQSQIKNALNRLVTSGKITSVWQGFYAVVLPEYGLRGVVPPIEYIDHLMTYLGKDYYVATLSAAALHGSSHHKPLTFTFVCNQILHRKEKNDIRLEPLLKKRIPHRFVEKKNVSSGTINISTPILTAIDLVLYPLKSGGFGNIATILAELSESIDMNSLDNDFFSFAPASAVQRLGYLLDVVLNETMLAEILLERAKSASVKFRKVPLAIYKEMDTENYFFSSRWKVVVNEEIEVDV